MGDTPTDFASDLPVLERIETLIVLCSDKYYAAGRRREIGLGGHDDAIVEGDAKRKEAMLLIERELTASQERVKELEAEVARLTKVMHEAAGDIRSIFGG